MAEEADAPSVVDSVTEATNGIGSEALAAIGNLGNGSGSVATSVVSRLGATITGRTGGFAPKAITTITKHGLAAIDRVEPIQGVDRGYRAVARDANGLESIRTVLDLDPREYDVTVTREDGVAIVEFVQQDAEPDAALPPGAGESSGETETTGSSPEPMAPVKGTRPIETEPSELAPTARTEAGRDGASSRSSELPPRRAPTARPATDRARNPEVEQARSQAEKSKAEAEAEKAHAEAEKAKAEAEAAKARAEAERVKAEAETKSVRAELHSGQDAPTADPDQRYGESTSGTEHAGRGRRQTKPTRSEGAAEFDTGFGTSDNDGSGFENGDGDEGRDGNRVGNGNWSGDRSGWKLGDSGETQSVSGGESRSEAESTDDDSMKEDGFGGFTSATPVEDEPPEYTHSGAIETTISVHDDGNEQGAVTDGESGDEQADEPPEKTGKFEF